MQVAGVCLHINTLALELAQTWKHLGYAECRDQVEWHLESEGQFSDTQIADASYTAVEKVFPA